MVKKLITEISKSKDNKYYFEILWKNWQTIVTSETYVNKYNAKRGLNNLLKKL